MAASFSAGMTIPVAQLITAILGLGVVGLIAYYWDIVKPVWDNLINWFKITFNSITDTIDDVFGSIYINLCSDSAKWTFRDTYTAISSEKHLSKNCLDTVRKNAPTELYYSPRQVVFMAIFDVPKDLKCDINALMDQDSQKSKTYSNKNYNITGYKLFVLYGFDVQTGTKNQIFHAHLRTNAKALIETTFLRYKNQLTWKILPSPVENEPKYNAGSKASPTRLSESENLKQI